MTFINLGHNNIREHCNRPFKTVEEMDETIIRNYNSLITDRDTVYILGDVSFRGGNPDNYLRRLKGHKHLIIGNHDSKEVIRSKYFESAYNLRTIKIAKEKIVLCHYGMRVWDSSFHGSWMLYGHSHSRLPPTTIIKDGKEYVRSFDVGVDCWDFYPISFELVRDIMNGLKKPRWSGDQRLADMEIGKIEPRRLNMEKFDGEKILAETKDFVIDRARPLIFDCLRTPKEQEELETNIHMALMYLDYVERSLDKEEIPLNYKKWSKD